ncbi:MAG TPA: tandem-95 repeat protein, partial [Halomicronema sp.]
GGNAGGGNAGGGNVGGGNTGVDGGNTGVGGGNAGVGGGNAGGGNAGGDGGNAGGGNAGGDGGNAGGGNAGGGGTTENQPPIFTGTTEFSINEDTPAIIPNPINNSSDPNNDPLSIINFTQPNNGILTQNEDGTFTYTPNPNFNGTDSFTVVISDGKGGTTTTEIILTINPVDDPLLVGNDNYITNENTPITLTNLLENDSSIDGSKFSITNFSNPQNGTLTQNQDGTFTYIPNPKYHGTDQFTYTITDSKGNTNTGTVNITINSINENPIVPNQTFTLQEDTPFLITNLLANATDGDGDVLTIARFSNPQNGTLTDNQDGTFTYIPNANFNGTDTFTYTVTDGSGGTTTATAILTINPVEDLPVAVVDSFTTLQNVPVNIPIANLLQNDSDADGDPLTLSNIFTNPSNGTLVQNNDGTWTYTPNPNFNGQDSFTYTISDSKGNITTGTINISIGAVNQPPQITGETFTTAEDTPLILENLLANDSDVENNTLTITEFNGLQNGTLTNNQNGTWTYIPNANFNGQETINYTVSDGNGGVSTGIININVTPVNDLPTISPIADQITTQNTPTNPFNFVVSDVETDPANLTITSTAANAALVQNVNILTGPTSNERNISITPAPGAFGTTTITVTVDDGTATSSHTFNLTVQALPVANPDNAGPVFLRTPLEIPITKLLENDSDADSTLNFIGVSNALNGTVSVGQNGIITFQANPNFSGTGSFDYTISDESGNTATATVTIPVIAELSLGNITTGVGLPVGVGGFSIFGEAAADNAGWSVGGIQDLNNDGFVDLLVSAPSADANALANSGKVYVVFGKTDGGIITLSTVSAGNGGFVVNGEAANNLTGHEVSTAGDVNGDNLPDLIIGAKSVNGGAGKVYVVLGSTLTTPVNLSSVSAGIGGFALNGELNSAAGNSVSDAGDVNGDGLSDLIIGAPDFSFDSSRMGAGRSYVVYGSTNPSSMNLSDVAAGIGGFAINGEAGGDNSGASVRSAGDVNGDGFADLIVGARFADNSGLADAGKSYIIFGGANLSSVDLLNVAAGGGGGFVISGLSANDRSGTSVSNAGDVNGDGLSDLIISSPGADASGAIDSGKAYVVFGQTASGVVSLTNLEAGIGGFVINGANANDFAGDTVRSAGDMNGDGFADLVVGAPRADQLSTNPPLTDLGKAFIIFGKSSTEQVNLSSVVTGNGGFSLTGEQAGDYMGRSVRVAGDVNGDGFDDLVIGSRFADPNNLGNAGKAYVVFGGNSSGAVSLPGTALDDVLTGTSAGESLVGGFGNDSLIGNGGPDVFYGGAGNDLIAVSSADFRLVNGGEGFDTLRLDGLSLNLSAIADGRLSSIERFDLSGVANNSLVLSRTEVLNLGTTSNQLVIDGTSGNTLTLADGLNTWQSGGPTTFNGSTYNLYQQGLASLLVDPEITVL